MATNDYTAFYQEAGKTYNVDPQLLRAVVQVESGGRPNAVSEQNAQGVAQIIPATQKALGVKNPFDPRESIFGAAKLLDENLARYGNANDAILAYHGGTDQRNWGPKTRAYLEKVTSAYQGSGNMPKTINTLGDEPSADRAAYEAFFGGNAAPAQAAPVKVAVTAAAPAQDPNRAAYEAFFGNQSAQPVQTAAVQQPAQAAPQGQPVPGAFTMGVGDTVKGAVQGLVHGIGAIANAVAPNSQIAKDFAAGVPQVDAQIRAQERAYQAQRQAQGKEGFDWARLGGGMAGTALVPNPIASALLQPVTEGDNFAAEKVKQGAIGAAIGGATKALGKVISPNVRPEVQTLLAEGVTPTPGQIAGGWVQRLEDKARSIPGIGDMITSAQRRGVEDLNRAAYARALQGVPNAKVPTTVGREAVDDVAKQLGGAYDDLLGKMHFQADQPFLQDMAGIATNVKNLPQAQQGAYQTFLNQKILDQMTPAGRMGGENLKLVEGALSREAKQFSGSPDPFNQKLGQELQNTLQAFRNGIERSNPAHAPQLQALNESYANFARLRDAAGRVGSAEGIFSPAQLNAAVRAADKSVAKGGYARGNALMQDLSDPAVNVLGPKYPDSGTAGRLALGAGLTGGLAAVNPAAVAGAALGAAPYTAPGQKLAAALLAQRPAAAATARTFIDQYGPRLGAMLAPAALIPQR